MEYVEGRNLSQVLIQSGRFSTHAAVAVIGQVLDALACAHGLGVVHRDVKPANILLFADQRVKMTDFGISRLDTSALTQAGSVLGTPSYMSPEQCRGEPVDARSDLFSAGVVLYEMLSGGRPFTGSNLTEVALQVMSQPPPNLQIVRPDVPSPLIAAIEQALSKDPQDRFGSAVAMASALRRSVAEDATADRTIIVRGPRTRFTAEALSTVERKLTQHVGPIARHLVQTAARQAMSMEELHEIVARRIDHPELRTRFRNEVMRSPAAPNATAIPPSLAQAGERELTTYVGPIARILVKRALQVAKSPGDFWQTLALHIEREADRRAFMSKRRE